MTKGLFDTALQGTGASATIAWFFKDTEYVRYNIATNAAEGLAQPIVGNWGQFNTWPGSFASGVDAALLGTGAFSGTAWFFRGPKYIVYNVPNDKVVDGPLPIAGNLGGAGWPAHFAGGVDAALHGVGSFAGKAWFFKGSQYIRLNLSSHVVEAGPSAIRDNWGSGGWPPSFDGGIDLAMYHLNDDTVVFFRGDQYILYRMSDDSVLSGPSNIRSDWPTLFNRIYATDTIWGVDSISSASQLLGSQTLFEYVREKCGGVAPKFFGRYTDLLTAQEAAYLHQMDCRILPIFRGATVGGNFAQGMADAAAAIQHATALGIPANVVVYVDIEPAWTPTRDWILGWWIAFAFSQYSDGIYFNSQDPSPFKQPYMDAWAMRNTIASFPPAAVLPQILALPPGTNPLGDTFLWAQFPQVPAFRDFSGCPTAPQSMKMSYAPGLHPSNPAGVVVWQFKINCLPFPLLGNIHDPVALNTGTIDNNLATAKGFSLMW
jgi:hypothetical protein